VRGVGVMESPSVGKKEVRGSAAAEGRRFSASWHRFVRAGWSGWGVDAPDDDILVGLEDQLAEYELTWRSFGEKILPVTYDQAKLAPEDRAGVLRYAALNLEVAQRIVLCRSIHLYRTFIGSVNREYISSLPLLLRAVMEQAAFGTYTAQRIHEGAEDYKKRGADGVRLLHEAVFSAIFGARMNILAFRHAADNYLLEDYGPWDELDVVHDQIAARQFGITNVPPEEKGLTVAAISKMIDTFPSLPDGAMNEVTPAQAPGMWEWLSQYCHPSSFSWSLYKSEIEGGGRYVPSRRERVLAKQRIMNPFVAVAWQICPLTGAAVTALGEVRREIEQMAEALARSP
jgi:hypothetical protein